MIYVIGEGKKKVKGERKMYFFAFLSSNFVKRLHFMKGYIKINRIIFKNFL